MRILQVSPVPPELGGTNTGGIAIHVWGLASHLAERGHDVAIIGDNRPYADPWPDRATGVPVYGIRHFAGPRRTRRLASPSAIVQTLRAKRVLRGPWHWRWALSKVAAYREVIDRFKPDVIHVHAPENRFTFVHSVTQGRIPSVVTVHSTHSIEYCEPGLEEAFRGLVGRNLELAQDIVFVSDFLRNRTEMLFPGVLDHARTCVIPNPLDVSIYAPVDPAEARRRLRLPADERVLLFVGNLIPRKAPLTFVRAIAELRLEGVPVKGVMVGSGPEESAVRAHIAALGLGDHIRLDGFKPQDALAEYYSACDLFVLPSLMESFGLVAVEAMLCGAPVIGTPEALAEVAPPFGGRRVATEDARELALAIAVALGQEWDRKRIRAFALGFDWDSKIQQFEELYEGLPRPR